MQPRRTHWGNALWISLANLGCRNYEHAAQKLGVTGTTVSRWVESPEMPKKLQMQHKSALMKLLGLTGVYELEMLGELDEPDPSADYTAGVEWSRIDWSQVSTREAPDTFFLRGLADLGVSGPIIDEVNRQIQAQRDAGSGASVGPDTSSSSAILRETRAS